MDSVEKNTFVGLGYDVMWSVASYCIDVNSIVRLGMTCKTLQRVLLLEGDNEVWAVAVKTRRLLPIREIELRERIDRALHEQQQQAYNEAYGDDDYAGGDDNDASEKRTAAAAAVLVADATVYATWAAIARRCLTRQHYVFIADLMRGAVAAVENEAAQGVHSLPPWETKSHDLHSTTNDAEEKKLSPAGLNARNGFRRIGTLDLTGTLCVGRHAAWVVGSALKYAETIDTVKIPGQNLANHGVGVLALAARNAEVFSQPSLAKNDKAPIREKDALEKVLAIATDTAPTPEAAEKVRMCFATLYGSTLPRYIGFGRALTTLVLSENKIEGKEGGMALAALLQYCPALHTLDVRQNRLDADGAFAISEAMVRGCYSTAANKTICMVPSRLERVFFDGNVIGDAGANAIIGGMVSCLSSRMPVTAATTKNVKHKATAANTFPYYAAPVEDFAYLRRSVFVISLQGCGLTSVPTHIEGLKATVGRLVDGIAAHDKETEEMLRTEKTSKMGHVPKENRNSRALPSLSILLGNGKLRSANRNAMCEKDVKGVARMRAEKSPFKFFVDTTNMDTGAPSPKRGGGCACM